MNASCNITSGVTYTPVAANTVALVSTGAIGSSTTSTLAVNAPNLTASAVNSSSFISDSQSVALADTVSFTNSANTSTGTYFLNANGNITSSGTYTPASRQPVALVSSGTIGSSTTSTLAINTPNLTASATGSSYISDSQSAALTDTGSSLTLPMHQPGTYFLNASGSITSSGTYTPVAANTVALVSSGTIGSSTTSAMAINTPNLTASAAHNSYFRFTISIFDTKH